MHRTLAARNAMFWLGSVFASTAANEQLLNSFFKKSAFVSTNWSMFIFFF
jgi:hypothetical protein